ncbi:MAG: hypothetical protein HY985_12725 [Magnetospirillum sp.]|nr:hypothetical protein [Magnetospirillum sp.]
MPFRPLLPLAALLLVAPTLTSCIGKPKEPPPCPPVFILSDTSHITKFKSGPGRDLTDVEVEAEIVGYTGNCSYKAIKGRTDAWDVEVELQISLEAKRGPANAARESNLSYFVAVPVFYPKPDAKADFDLTVPFPAGTDVVRHTDDPVTINIPVPADDIIDKYEVYIGFQTTVEQLERNRKAKR